jgi:hypothetical protein
MQFCFLSSFPNTIPNFPDTFFEVFLSFHFQLTGGTIDQQQQSFFQCPLFTKSNDLNSQEFSLLIRPRETYSDINTNFTLKNKRQQLLHFR